MKVNAIIETLKKILSDSILVNFESSSDSDLKGIIYFKQGDFHKETLNINKVKVELNFELTNIIASANDPDILVDKIQETLLDKFYVENNPLYINGIRIITIDTGLSTTISIEYENEKTLVDSSEIIGVVNFKNK